VSDRGPTGNYQEAGGWYVARLHSVLSMDSDEERLKSFRELLSGEAADNASIVFEREFNLPYLLMLRAAVVLPSEILRTRFVSILGNLLAKALDTASGSQARQAAWPLALFKLADAYVTDMSLTHWEHDFLSERLLEALDHHLADDAVADPLVTQALKVAVDLRMLLEPDYWKWFVGSERSRQHIVMAGLCLYHLEQAVEWIQQRYDPTLVEIFCERLESLVVEWTRPRVERLLRGSFLRNASWNTQTRINQQWRSLGFPPLKARVSLAQRSGTGAPRIGVVQKDDLDALCRNTAWLKDSKLLWSTVEAVRQIPDQNLRMRTAIRIAGLSRELWRQSIEQNEHQPGSIASLFNLKSFADVRTSNKNNPWLPLSAYVQRLLVACELRLWVNKFNGFVQIQTDEDADPNAPCVWLRVESFSAPSPSLKQFDETRAQLSSEDPPLDSFDFELAKELAPTNTELSAHQEPFKSRTVALPQLTGAFPG
jgi:hypothetical protein